MKRDEETDRQTKSHELALASLQWRETTAGPDRYGQTQRYPETAESCRRKVLGTSDGAYIAHLWPYVKFLDVIHDRVTKLLSTKSKA